MPPKLPSLQAFENQPKKCPGCRDALKGFQLYMLILLALHTSEIVGCLIPGTHLCYTGVVAGLCFPHLCPLSFGKGWCHTYTYLYLGGCCWPLPPHVRGVGCCCCKSSWNTGIWHKGLPIGTNKHFTGTHAHECMDISICIYVYILEGSS